MRPRARPAALRVDPVREILYVADACNHRIALYDLDGKILDYWGEPGQGPGQLRYPYDLELMPNGDILVCDAGIGLINFLFSYLTARAEISFLPRLP